MDSLNSGLDSLGGKVLAKGRAMREQKASDWARVLREYPDQAAVIRAISSRFGKPSSVKVTTDDGEVLMDSNRYK